MRIKIFVLLAVITATLFSISNFFSDFKSTASLADFSHNGSSKQIASGWSVPPPDGGDDGFDDINP